MAPTDDETFLAAYTEYKDWDTAAEILEHEEQEEEYFAMAEKLNSTVDVRDFGNCSVHGGKGRRVNLSLSGYGYGQRKPDFHATPCSLNLYMSVQEAREVITKLEALLHTCDNNLFKEKAS